MSKLNLYLFLPLVLMLLFFNNIYGQTAKSFLDAGNIKYNNMDPSGAILDFTNAIALKPDFEAAYYRRGLAKNAIEDYAGAISDYSMAIELSLLQQAKFDIENNANDTSDEEIVALNKQIKELRGILMAFQYCDRGISKYKINDFDGAISDFNKSINFDSCYATAYYERGYVKFKKFDFEGAIADFNIVIKMDSNYTEAYNGRGHCKAQILDYDGAFSDFNKSLEIDSANHITFFERGSIKIDVDDFTGAIEDYSKAIELNPQYRDAYFGRGLVKSLLNDMEGACADLHIAKEFGGKEIGIIQEEIENICSKDK